MILSRGETRTQTNQLRLEASLAGGRRAPGVETSGYANLRSEFVPYAANVFPGLRLSFYTGRRWRHDASTLRNIFCARPLVVPVNPLVDNV